MKTLRNLFTALLVSVMALSAQAQVTLPDTGIAVDEYATAGIAYLTTPLGVIIGGFVSFTLLRIAVRALGRWLNRAV